MSDVTFLEARQDAIAEEMRRDPKVILWGEDTRHGLSGIGGSAFCREFGRQRIFDSPLSENAMIGVAIGASMMGYRPIVDLAVANFATLGFDQLVNQASRIRYLFGGQARCPIVVRMAMNTENAGGSQHTDRHYPMLMNVPGLKIVCPTTPLNAKGLWKSAIRDDGPVVIYEARALSARRNPIPDDPDFTLPLGSAEVVREGTSVTLVTIFTRAACLGAAEALAAEGAAIEVIDPRTLAPLDTRTILTSVRKTGRLVIADLANDTNSAASHIAAIVAERAFDALKAPIRRVCTPDVHIPHSSPLEKLVFPTQDRITKVLREVVGA